MGKEDKSNFRGWVIIFVLAVSFACWGLFIFFTVGDKGPPSWNFGAVRDIPGESPYSTHQTVKGRGVPPEFQHVLGKPSQIEGEARKEKP
jgi:hypothetical protein